MLPFILDFCRVVTGLVFSLAFLSKVKGFASFEQTITNFALLPRRFSRYAALLFLSGELLVVLLMLLGGRLLFPGFLLGSGLLLLFCAALISVLVRKIETSCGCFGPTQKPISVTDVWRNGGLLVCTLCGLGITISPMGQAELGLAAWMLLVVVALLFVAFWLNLGEIVQLFGQG